MACLAAMMSLFAHDGASQPETRLLAVGGTHVFDDLSPCRLLNASPEGAVKNLGWRDGLALDAIGEGHAEVACRDVRWSLEMVAPARLAIDIVDDTPPAAIAVGQDIIVQARLYDRDGRELEVGKLTEFAWSASGIVERAVDRSAGEFGLCDTCYGMHGFRAVTPGRGVIKARFGSLKSTLTVATGS